MLSLHCWRRDIASLSSPRGHYTYSYCFIRHSLPWCTALHIACIHNLRFIHHTLSQDRAFTTLHSVSLRSVVHYPYSSQASSFFKRSSQRVRSFHYPYSTIIRYGSRPTRLYLIDWWRQIVLIIVIRLYSSALLSYDHHWLCSIQFVDVALCHTHLLTAVRRNSAKFLQWHMNSFH